ncbi:unnamed protein product [Cuscuta epithymum]|uniref:CCHC-type domain-containing protein n=2 Tax=Cuscuta epithymum TaxID=186058 RepID=A0AAV0C034_9ASTE|nr:unnamed protein product [Cuscuta epithymum]
MVGEGSRTPSRSPVRRGRSPTRRGGREVVVQQRVVHQASSTVVYPTLTATNYFEWALIMKVNMEAQGVWDAVEGGGSFSEDRVALAAILRAVPPEMLSTLAVKATAKEAWDAIKTMRVGDERVREAKAQTLLKEFDSVRMRSGETIDDLTMRMNGLANKIRTLGETFEEVKVVKKLLRIVPSKYTQVAIAIEQLLDLKTMSMEELVGRLKTVEDRSDADDGVDNNDHGGGGQLLLTEEEWRSRYRGGTSKKKSTFDIRKVRCYNCQEYGHFSKDCTAPRKEQAHLAFATADYEPALL